jgi:hypothetical protein
MGLGLFCGRRFQEIKPTPLASGERDGIEQRIHIFSKVFLALSS